MLIYMIVCTGVLPWIVLDLLHWKTQWLFTYIRSGSVSHYFPVGSHKLCLSRTVFVYVKNWKNSENSSISQLCFLSVIYLRFIKTLVKGMFDLQIDKKKKKEMSSMNKSLCRIGIRQVTFDRMVMILYRTYNSFSLFAMQLNYCNIQRVFDQK